MAAHIRTYTCARMPPNCDTPHTHHVIFIIFYRETPAHLNQFAAHTTNTAVTMGRSAPLRALSMAATAAVVRGFLSPSCGGHCGGASPLPFTATTTATTATSPPPASAAAVSRGCSTSGASWRPAAPARHARLGALHMVRSVAVLLFLYVTGDSSSTYIQQCSECRTACGHSVHVYDDPTAVQQ